MRVFKNRNELTTLGRIHKAYKANFRHKNWYSLNKNSIFLGLA